MPAARCLSPGAQGSISSRKRTPFIAPSEKEKQKVARALSMQIPERRVASSSASGSTEAAESPTSATSRLRNTVSFLGEHSLGTNSKASGVSRTAAEATSSMQPPGRDDSVAWEKNGPACSLCGVSFLCFFKRRHHCRLCGKCICKACSKNSIELSGSPGPQRACDACISAMSKRDKHIGTIALACGTMSALLGNDASGGFRARHSRAPQQVAELLSSLTAELAEGHRSHNAMELQLKTERLNHMEMLQSIKTNIERLEEQLDKSKRVGERAHGERVLALQAILQLSSKISSIVDESGARPAEQPLTLEEATQLCSAMSLRLGPKLRDASATDP